MITLDLDTPEELAEAIYFAETTATVIALNLPPRGNDWHTLAPEIRAIKVAAAGRLVALYHVDTLTLKALR